MGKMNRGRLIFIQNHSLKTFINKQENLVKARKLKDYYNYRVARILKAKLILQNSYFVSKLQGSLGFWHFKS